jgi:hypothetical protein
MIDRAALLLDGLVESYLFANTPSYLLRRFRVDPQVSALSLRGADELVEVIRDVAQAADRGVVDVVAAYAAAVALIIQGAPQASQLANDSSLRTLVWLSRVFELGLSQSRSTTAVSLIAAPITTRLDPESETRSMAATQASSFILRTGQ